MAGKEGEIKRQHLYLLETTKISEFLANRWQEAARAAICKKGLFAAALSGGKTPVDFYLRLAEQKDANQWHGIHVFLADERAVPFDHPDSNYRLLTETFLSKVPIPRQNIHPITTTPWQPAVSAAQFDEELRGFFRVYSDAIPVFDFILLGIGTDGHTASLFPGDRAVIETGRLSTFVFLDAQRHDRITMTLNLINQAEQVIMLATGASKAEIMKRILVERDGSLPASMVKPAKGSLSFLLDSFAASQLNASCIKEYNKR